jgi:hypothetical protein
MGKAHSTHGKMIDAYKTSASLVERIFEKKTEGVGVIWLKIVISSGFFRTRNETSSSTKK